MIKKKHIIGTIILFRIIVPIVLLALPATYFDTGKAVCLSKVLFNQECPACGLTRSCMHLIHFEFFEAFEFNMMGFIVFPILAALWTILFFKEVKQFVTLINSKTAQEEYE